MGETEGAGAMLFAFLCPALSDHCGCLIVAVTVAFADVVTRSGRRTTGLNCRALSFTRAS